MNRKDLDISSGGECSLEDLCEFEISGAITCIERRRSQIPEKVKQMPLSGLVAFVTW